MLIILAAILLAVLILSICSMAFKSHQESQTKRCGRRRWIEVDTGAVYRNVKRIRAWIGKDVEVVVMVKADAYGHGTKGVVRALNNLPWVRYGVADVHEGSHVSKWTSAGRVLIFGSSTPDEMRQAIKSGIVFSVNSVGEMKTALSISRCLGKVARIQWAIDTGMGREGVWWQEVEQTISEANEILKFTEHVRLESCWTHLPESQGQPAIEQISNWETLVETVMKPKLRHKTKFHILNGEAALFFKNHAQDCIRPGILSYGIYPQSPPSPSPKSTYTHPLLKSLEPAMRYVKTRITFVRKMGPGRRVSYAPQAVLGEERVIATIGMGYEDGISRNTKGGVVLVKGILCPIVGKITMDQTMIDVTSVEGVQPGDEVCVLDSQHLSVHKIAEYQNTTPWEVLVRFGERLPIHIVSRTHPSQT